MCGVIFQVEQLKLAKILGSWFRCGDLLRRTVFKDFYERHLSVYEAN